jgi:hypothetical protein
VVPVPQDEQPTPEQERREFQAFLGQHHGLLGTVLDHPEWFPTEGEGIDSLRDAYLACCEQFGVAQGALNSGEHDEALQRGGLSGAARRLKIGRWFDHLRDFYGRLGREGNPKRPLRRALRWANVMLGSTTFVPGIGYIHETTQAVEALLEDAERTAEDQP